MLPNAFRALQKITGNELTASSAIFAPVAGKISAELTERTPRHRRALAGWRVTTGQSRVSSRHRKRGTLAGQQRVELCNRTCFGCRWRFDVGSSVVANAHLL